MYSTKYPDNVGPIAGAKPITNPNIPIYFPRSCGSNISNIVVIISGIIIPEPNAWIILAINKVVKLGLKPPSKVPRKI